LLEYKPLTPDLWDDLEKLFGPHGADGGCWCMWWRIPRAQFVLDCGEPNKQAFKEIVKSGVVPGILGYDKEKPVAWCAVAPREQYPVLDRSPLLKRIDAKSVWSIVCFFIHKDYRTQGLVKEIINAAAAYAKGKGVKIIEAYPVDSLVTKDGWKSFRGTVKTFQECGFEIAAQRKPGRPVMRRYF